ncbi:MAG: hypothetical protein C4576_11380 [Desulfobacteraceae bacterium]|nr:MAG: hypothetical protein C4576_11380 [Desulfobacteraceae bacterium]
MYGDQPYGVVRTGQTDPKALFKSRPENAFIKDISIPAGYGVILAGTVMGIITESTSRKGMYVPYVCCDNGISVGLTTYPGLAYLTLDGAANAYAYVTMQDSYKFAVGDHLAAADSDTDGASAVDLGPILAIDRTTYSHIAKITVTNNVTTEITMANGGCIFIQSKTTAPFVEAKGILAGGVDTGIGELAKGGSGNLVLGNAVLYKGALYGYDAEVLTDLGCVEDGNLIYMK